MNELSTICPHFKNCSGCVLPLDLNAPPIWNGIKNFFSKLGLIPELEIGTLTQWRLKSKLAIRRKHPDSDLMVHPKYLPVQIGLFRAGTHFVQAIPFCLTHHHSINRAVQFVEQGISKENISIYDEKTGKGLLRYMQCLVDPITERVQLVLVAQSEDVSLKNLVERLITQSELWHSVWINIQEKFTNQILGEKWIHKYGERFLFLKLAGHLFSFHPASFAQAHWMLFERLACFVVEQVPINADLLEIYAGVGIMGTLAADQCKRVRLVENNSFSQQSFEAIKRSSNIHYHLKDAKEAIGFLTESTCIILDPPRKGIDPDLLNALATHSGKIIYVSCNFYSFQRDVEVLIQEGWIMKFAKGYLLFPGTNHVEIVGILEKNPET